MPIAQRNEKHHPQIKTVKIDGTEIPIISPSFEVSEKNWETFKAIVRKEYLSDKAKSEAIRILINAVNLKLIDLKDLESHVVKKAEKSEDVIYI